MSTVKPSPRPRLLLIVALASALAAVMMGPAWAAKHADKATGACAQSAGRCVADCDAFNWCTMYTCSNGQSMPVRFWRCFQPSGLCLAPHC